MKRIIILAVVMMSALFILNGCATKKIASEVTQKEQLTIADMAEQLEKEEETAPDSAAMSETEEIPEVSEETPVVEEPTGGETAPAEETSEEIAAELGETEEAPEAEVFTPLAPAPELPEIWTYDFPKLDLSGWQYILANPDHAVGDYVPTLVTVEGLQADYRVVDALKEMIADCRAAGNSVYLYSAYRSYQTQVNLFQRKVSQVGSEEKAATIVARPGTSEHQTGLAFDITDQFYSMLTYDLEYTATYKWLKAHCAEYGFILRYDKSKVDITKIIYEPWHFRYVGEEAAAYIMEHNLCYEEFLALYEGIYPTELIGAETLHPELLTDSPTEDETAMADE